MMTTILNIAHQSPFGLLFINYSLLLGASGGLAVIWSFLNWGSQSKTNLLPVALAFALAFGGILNVLAEVQQPGRLIYGFIYGWEHWYGSIIKYGVLILPLFCLLLILQLTPLKLSIFVDKLTKILLIGTGIFLGMYSGIFMTNEHGIALWNTPLSAVLMLLSGLYTGFIAYSLVSKHSNEQPAVISSYCGLGVMLITMFILLLFTWWGHVFAGETISTSFGLLDSNYLATQIITVGALVLACVMISVIKSKNKLHYTIIIILSAISAWGVRFLLLVGGQGTSRSSAGVFTYHPEPKEYLYSVGSIFFMVGILALVILLYENFQHKYPAQTGGEIK
ncbi:MULTISPECIES: hypothetical protein [Citrobacter]|jgi:formate-dependent nitrite reductase membrane component NrfD|nr:MULTISPECIES: hypothetical protein [Citrobacter]NTX86958.1 hypothetical protein [Citrobacter youngae]HCL6053602.1 hypothetical protein [Raoultella ornithinolytica]ATX99214.1 hypothetical protein AM349_24490 [Citrobacter freundii]EKU0870295.1 hypothetical protein [Citrobacter freundii]EKU7863397.1 hypothetical protein [Citrobacter freundii]